MTRSPLKPIIVAAICLMVVLLASVLAAQQPSTALIRCSDSNGMYSIGSGVLIAHGKKGWSLVATAAHVVESARTGGITAVFPHAPGKPTLTCKLAGYDRKSDVAILGIPTPDIQPSPLQTDVAVGTQTVREGFPRSGSVRVSPGSIVNHYGDGRQQHSPSAISGESGGPVRNTDGYVVGLVTTSDNPDGHGNFAQGPTSETILKTVPVQWQPYCIECPPQYAQVIDNDIPPAPPLPKAPRVVSPRPTPAAKPETTVDYEKLAKAIIEGMAGDDRFKGATGPAGPRGEPGQRGPTGPDGPAGADGRNANPTAILALQQRVGRLEQATFNVEVVTPSGEILTGEVHAHGGLLKLDFSTY